MTINRPAASASSHSGVPAKKMIFSLIVILSLTFLWCVISIFRSPHKYPIDDAYFYLVIAYNYSHGLGSTFTGFQPTNGYHPLWMLLLALVCRISPFGKAALIYEACALQFALMLVGCAAIFRIFRNSFLMAAWAIVIYEAVFLGKGTLSLMEIWLATPLLLISVLLLNAYRILRSPLPRPAFSWELPWLQVVWRGLSLDLQVYCSGLPRFGLPGSAVTRRLELSAGPENGARP